MRIIAGRFKNRRLASVKGRRLRPTSDRTRETIFSMVGPQLMDSRVLDLFAGTGALGIEALSRGAREATFVDRSLQAASIIEKNLQHLNLQANLYRSDVLTFFRIAQKNGWQYDLIFCDPPYRFEQMDPVLAEIAKNRLIVPAGLVIVESSSRSTCTRSDDFCIIKQKKIGDTLITFYGWQDEA